MREEREKNFFNSSVRNVSIIRKDPDQEKGCERESIKGCFSSHFVFLKWVKYAWIFTNKHFKSGIQFAQCWNDWMDLPTRKHLKTCDLTHSTSTCTDSISSARRTRRVWTLSWLPGLATHLQSGCVKRCYCSPSWGRWDSCLPAEGWQLGQEYHHMSPPEPLLNSLWQTASHSYCKVSSSVTQRK